MDSSTHNSPRDRFRVDSRLGRGGMGDVYKAYDTVLQRTVAVKTLTPGNADVQAVQRLLREARACARLTHPGIVTIHDVLESEGSVYIVMEHLPGASLELLHKFPRLSSFEAKIGIVIRILEALHYAHGRGVVHRDVKPRNVQILPDGSVKLLDFGVAHVAGVDALTATGTVTGTAHYASPEQLRGEESGAGTDVYSTGILAYEILTRRRPFDGDSVATVVAKVLHDPLPPMATSWSEAFPEIEHILQRAVAKRVQDRYASAEDMENALVAFLASSRDAIVTKQAEVQATTERVLIEAKSLIASGRMAEATPLLTSVLRSNPDAEEARTLLEAGQDTSGIVAASPASAAPPKTGSESTLLIGAERLGTRSRSVGDTGSAPAAAEKTAPPQLSGWSRVGLVVAAASVLVVVGTMLIGPSWLSRESRGVESLSEPTALPPAESMAALPGSDAEEPATVSAERSRVASNAELRADNGQPAAVAAAAPPQAAARPAPERVGASVVPAVPSSPGATAPAPAASVEADVASARTLAAGAKVSRDQPLTIPRLSSAEGRIALLIGNGAYSTFGELRNPRNDAEDVGAAFGRLGFDVTTVLDAGRSRMHEALQAFARRSVGVDVAVVFYAGHGMEMDGVNYLVPVDAQLERDADVEFETVQLDQVLRATQGAALRVVILDACRNNPLAQRMRRTRATRSLSPGSFGALDELLLVDETLVAYAAAAGTTATDGTGRNSPYTAALLSYLEEPLELSALFRRIGGRVLETTGGAQRPRVYQSLLGDHYLSDGSGETAQSLSAAYSPSGVDVEWVRSRPGRSRPAMEREQQAAVLRPRANPLTVSVTMSVSSGIGLPAVTDGRLEGEVRAILRGHGIDVIEPIGGGSQPVVRIEGTVEVSDAGDVAGTGLMSSTAVVSIQAVEEATNAVVAAARARSPGAGISQDDARDGASIRAVEEALATLSDDLSAAWSNRARQ